MGHSLSHHLIENTSLPFYSRTDAKDAMARCQQSWRVSEYFLRQPYLYFSQVLNQSKPKVLCYTEARFCSLIALVSKGAISKTSPTIPKSAISKIGASASLLMATIILLELMPTWC